MEPHSNTPELRKPRPETESPLYWKMRRGPNFQACSSGLSPLASFGMNRSTLKKWSHHLSSSECLHAHKDSWICIQLLFSSILPNKRTISKLTIPPLPSGFSLRHPSLMAAICDTPDRPNEVLLCVRCSVSWLMCLFFSVIYGSFSLTYTCEIDL